MNFFEHQANARLQTRRLRFYFALSVLLTLLAVHLGFFLLFLWLAGPDYGFLFWYSLRWIITVGVLLIILVSGLWAYWKLRGGGAALAKMMEARRIDFATRSRHERQLINVVEEMAIASGIPVPVLYVMDGEAGINAFAAGHSIDTAIVVVTEGTLLALNRSELQAVVGHEFGHILNGDMCLNMRLLALLAGITSLGQFGVSFLKSTVVEKPNPVGIIIAVVLAILLYCAGAIGLLFGRLIKAAISRQREFLADASSIQFTRNTDGLAFALLKIKYLGSQSLLKNSRAESVSHMCFSAAEKRADWLATHPPLDARIKALGRQYLVYGPVHERLQREVQEVEALVLRGGALSQLAPGLEQIAAFSGAVENERVTGEERLDSGLTEKRALPMAPEVLLAHSGTVSPADMVAAQSLRNALPAEVELALYSSDGARALLYALMLKKGSASADAVAPYLAQHEPALQIRIHALVKVLADFDQGFSLPLAELALPRLRVMAASAQKAFLERLQGLAQLDRHLSIFEFSLLMLLRKQLRIGPAVRPVRMEVCAPMIGTMLAAVLRSGGMDEAKLAHRYQELMCAIASPVPALPAADQARLSQLAVSMQVLTGLSVTDKKTVLELLALAVCSDAVVRQDEYELLRVIAVFLDCPMPMLVV